MGYGDRDLGTILCPGNRKVLLSLQTEHEG